MPPNASLLRVIRASTPCRLPLLSPNTFSFSPPPPVRPSAPHPQPGPAPLPPLPEPHLPPSPPHRLAVRPWLSTSSSLVTWQMRCVCPSLPTAANRRRSLATGPWPARRLNASAGATSWRCCHGTGLRQWMPWLRMRLLSRTLLRLARKLGGLRRGLNRPCGHS